MTPEDLTNIVMPAFGLGYLVGASFASVVWLLNRRQDKA